MVSFGGIVATGAALSWAVVYACTQQILKDMTPMNLLTSTYLVAGIVSLIPFAVFGNASNLSHSVKQNPAEFAFYVIMILVAKYLMIWSVKLIGAVAAGLIEISYVRCLNIASCYRKLTANAATMDGSIDVSLERRKARFRYSGGRNFDLLRRTHYLTDEVFDS
jgi:hypothetical protein